MALYTKPSPPLPTRLLPQKGTPFLEQSRLYGLDYLRGLAALGIMIYHYSSWIFGEVKPSSFLGRTGIYGVVIFYILSGITLSHIYSRKLKITKAYLSKFYLKRFYRIFPLLWLATILSISISKDTPRALDVFLNLSGLFGLFRWDTYFATGAWSIGNELVFYLFFPVALYAINNSRLIPSSIAILVVAIFIYFSFFKLINDGDLFQQWHVYTNPLNQIIFFGAGILIGKFVRPYPIKRILSFSLFAAGISAYCFLPVSGSATDMVTGFTRVAFGVSCVLICLGLFGVTRAYYLIDKPLSLLGKASYSLYLLHPIVFAVCKVMLRVLATRGVALPQAFVFAMAVFGSLFLSQFSYRYFETYFINIGRKAGTEKRLSESN